MPSVLISAWITLVLVAYLGPIRFAPERIFSAFTTQGLGWTWSAALGAWAGHAGRVAAAALAAAAAWGTGRRACSVLRIRESAWLAAYPAGLVLLGLLGLGMGLVGLARSMPLGAVLAGAIAAGLMTRPRRRSFSLPAMTPDRLAWIVAGAVVLINLPMALAPEVTYDALAVHLGAPAEFLKLGRLVRLDHVMYADLPLVLEMNYLFAMALGGDGAAKLLHFLLGIAAIAAVGRLAHRLLPGPSAGRDDRSSGAWAMGFLAATPGLATLMGRANVDLGVMVLTTAGAFWLVRNRSRAGMLFAGLLLGGATSVKLTGGYGVVAGLVVAALSGQAGQPALIFLAGAAAAYLPWLTKTWLLTGNPVYPFGWLLLGGCGWSLRNAAIFHQDVQGQTAANLEYVDPLAQLAVPWLLVMKDRITAGALGPFVLMFLPIVAMAPPLRARRAVRRLGVMAGVVALCWFTTSRDPRFLLPAWPMMCALAAVALTALSGPAGRFSRTAAAVVIVLTLPFEAASLWYSFSPGPVLWGAIARERYAGKIIEPKDRYVPMALAATTACPPGRRVLMVGEVKGAWIGPRVLYPTMPDTPQIEDWVRASPSIDRLMVRLRQADVGLVFFESGEVAYWRRQFGHYLLTPREDGLLNTLWARLHPLIWTGQPNPLVIFEVVPPGHRPPARSGIPKR